MLRGEAFGRTLTLDEQVSIVRSLLVGGFDTTAIAIAAAVWCPANHPDDYARLLKEPGLVDTMCEDVIRFASPSTCLRREVTCDTELG